MEMERFSPDEIERKTAQGKLRRVRQYHGKEGQQFRMTDSATYQVAPAGNFIRTDPKSPTKKERNRMKRAVRG